MRNWCIFLARIISGDQYFEGLFLSFVFLTVLSLLLLLHLVVLYILLGA
jgi:hypothetical protein